jgi:hypothetical protein
MPETVTRTVEHDGESWVVRSSAAGRVSYRTTTRGNAVARAKEIVRNLGGGQVEIHAPDGHVEQVARVAPAPRGRRRSRGRPR